MIFLKGQGLVIGKQETGEADRYITIFMEDYGRISCQIKGIRKSKKRDKTAVDIINLTEFTFYKKGEAIIIADFYNIEAYPGIKSDINKINIAYYFLYLLNKILVENGRDRKLYKLVTKSLNYLNKTDDEKKNLLLVSYFLYEIIKNEGIFPENIGISAFFIEGQNKNISINKKEKLILEELFKNNVKELIDDESYQQESIKKVIIILERYININLDLKLDARKFLWGDLLW